jgi:pre-mRNA-splicing factor CWC22
MFLLGWQLSHAFLIDIYKLDPNFLENEEKYKEIKAEILGEGSDDEDESGSSDSDNDSEGEAGKNSRIM